MAPWHGISTASSPSPGRARCCTNRRRAASPATTPFFPLGYGLRYADNGNLPPLPEAPGADIESSQAGIFFQRGKISPPWLLAFADDRGNVQPIGTLPANIAGGRVRVSRVDLDAQEDSLRFQWLTPATDSSMSGVQLDSREAFDFGREANGDIMLVLTVRVGTQPSGPVDLAMACGQSCRGAVRFDPLLRNVPVGGTRRVGVFLKCFEKAGATDMKSIRTGLSLRTAGTLDVTVQRVALGTVADERIACYN